MTLKRKDAAARKKRAGVPVEIEVGGKILRLPRYAFEEGAQEIGLSSGTYVGIDDYASSVQAFLEALGELGST